MENEIEVELSKPHWRLVVYCLKIYGETDNEIAKNVLNKIYNRGIKFELLTIIFSLFIFLFEHHKFGIYLNLKDIKYIYHKINIWLSKQKDRGGIIFGEIFYIYNTLKEYIEGLEND